MQFFSDYKPGVNLIKNQCLPGPLMSYSGLFHEKKKKDNLVIKIFLKIEYKGGS